MKRRLMAGRELAQSLSQFSPSANILRQRLIFEFQFGANQALRYDKTLTGLNLDEDQASRAPHDGWIGPQAVLTSVDSRITCPPLA